MTKNNKKNNFCYYEKDEFNCICEECKKEDESVRQNLIMTGYKLCKSCRVSKTLFPI